MNARLFASLTCGLMTACGPGWEPDWRPHSPNQTLLDVSRAQRIRNELERVTHLSWYGGKLHLGYPDRRVLVAADTHPGRDSVLKLARYPDTLTPGRSFGPACTVEHRSVQWFCDADNGRIVDAKGSVLVSRYGDRPLNGPVAAVVVGDNLYFADRQDGNENGRVYRYDFASDRLTRESMQVRNPGGMTFVPSQKRLVVSDADEQHPRWMYFDVEQDGSLSQGTIFADFSPVAGSWPGTPGPIFLVKDTYLVGSAPGGMQVMDLQGSIVQVVQTRSAVTALVTGQEDIYYVEGRRLIRIPFSAGR